MLFTKKTLAGATCTDVCRRWRGSRGVIWAGTLPVESLGSPQRSGGGDWLWTDP